MAVWFPVPDKSRQYLPSNFYNNPQIASEWTWNPEHDTLYKETELNHGFHSIQSLLQNYTNFLDDYWNLSTFVTGYLEKNTVPLFLLMQRLYNWYVRVDDVVSTIYNKVLISLTGSLSQNYRNCITKVLTCIMIYIPLMIKLHG